MKTPKIDLNSDLGEGCGDDKSMLRIVTSANIACGEHAGGGELLAETVELAYQNQVRIGAHPSYPDRKNFGRISMAGVISQQELVDTCVEQILRVVEEAKKHNIGLSHVKLHGALYNDAMKSESIAETVVLAIRTVQENMNSLNSYPLMGMPGSALEEQAKQAGIAYVCEGFTDRAYRSVSELVPRREANAVHDSIDNILRQVKELVFDNTITLATGESVTTRVESLCIHGDTPNAVYYSEQVRQYLRTMGAQLRGERHHV